MSMSKSDVLLESLTRFFSEPKHSEQLADILAHRNGISLRNLEWFVTNYAKNKHVTYTTPAGKQFTVHVAYKSSLDGYSKKLFDPFCRTERIEFQGFSTTVGQLNFIKWAISNGVIDYILNNADVAKKSISSVPTSVHQ
jgi:sulfur relay (sulfurtransferase) DsrC/TusE family protein